MIIIRCNVYNILTILQDGSKLLLVDEGNDHKSIYVYYDWNKKTKLTSQKVCGVQVAVGVWGKGRGGVWVCVLAGGVGLGVRRGRPKVVQPENADKPGRLEL